MAGQNLGGDVGASTRLRWEAYPMADTRGSLLQADIGDRANQVVSGRRRSLHLLRGRLLPYVYHSATLTIGIVSRGWPP